MTYNILDNKQASDRPNKIGSPILRRSFHALICLVLASLICIGLLPILAKTLLFQLPHPSAAFDCDDGTLFMYDRLSNLGIQATPFVGNLLTTGEKYSEINHIWILVEIGGITIAFDWGTPWFDKQHYEGYPINYQELVEFVKQDQYNSADTIYGEQQTPSVPIPGMP